MLGLLQLFGLALLLVIFAAAGVLLRLLGRPPRRTEGWAMARRLAVEPAEADLAGEAIELTFDDGSNSPGWLLRGQRDAGPTLIVTHDWGESRFVSLELAPLLARVSSNVIVYDLRGHGDSTATRSAAGRREGADLARVVEQVRAMLGPGQPIVLVGRGLGAGASVEAALRLQTAGKAVAGVVAEGVDRDGLTPLRQSLALRRWPGAGMADLAWALGRLIDGPGFDREKQAAQLDCPLLLLHARRDPLAPLAGAERIAAAAARAQRVVFDGGGRLDLAWRAPERYLDALCQFF